MVDYKKQGKKNRKSGADFERRVRDDLESKGWIVDRWTNNVNFMDANSVEVHAISDRNGGWLFGKLIPAKPKWTPRGIIMNSAGFPDFIAIKRILNKWDVPVKIINSTDRKEHEAYVVMGVECKSKGNLTKEEKEKCNWLIQSKVFSKILIAKKTKEKNRIKIVYKKFS